MGCILTVFSVNKRHYNSHKVWVLSAFLLFYINSFISLKKYVQNIKTYIMLYQDFFYWEIALSLSSMQAKFRSQKGDKSETAYKGSQGLFNATTISSFMLKFKMTCF